ncbi:MAG: TIGR01777 family oxidoreductase [Labilithrix sp.]|nr:TIGR01777 family oxidoreductase [Labilithrix sp.]
MRVVVSGGTGFVGRALCHALVGSGARVVILTRGPTRDLAHACSECGAGGKLEFATWTPERAGPWMDVVDGADAVVHLAGASVADERWTPARKELLRSSRITSTALLCEAIGRAKNKPSVFVSASAVGRYGMKTGDAVVTEDAPVGDDFLARLTEDWEDAAKPAADAGVRVVHPRLGLVLGRGGGVYGKLAPLFRSFVGGPVGSGTQYVPWVHVRDVVRALQAMIERSDLSGAYNVTAPEPVTMNAFALALGASLGRPAAMRVPAFAVKLAMGAEAAEAVLTGQRAAPKRLVDAGFAFVFPDLRSALADLASVESAVPVTV